MADKPQLIKCDICDGNVSSGAEKCPHCGEIGFSRKKVRKCALCRGSGFINSAEYQDYLNGGSFGSFYGERRQSCFCKTGYTEAG